MLPQSSANSEYLDFGNRNIFLGLMSDLQISFIVNQLFMCFLMRQWKKWCREWIVNRRMNLQLFFEKNLYTLYAAFYID